MTLSLSFKKLNFSKISDQIRSHISHPCQPTLLDAFFVVVNSKVSPACTPTK